MLVVVGLVFDYLDASGRPHVQDLRVRIQSDTYVAGKRVRESLGELVEQLQRLFGLLELLVGAGGDYARLVTLCAVQGCPARELEAGAYHSQFEDVQHERGPEHRGSVLEALGVQQLRQLGLGLRQEVLEVLIVLAEQALGVEEVVALGDCRHAADCCEERLSRANGKACFGRVVVPVLQDLVLGDRVYSLHVRGEDSHDVVLLQVAAVDILRNVRFGRLRVFLEFRL